MNDEDLRDFLSSLAAERDWDVLDAYLDKLESTDGFGSNAPRIVLDECHSFTFNWWAWDAGLLVLENAVASDADWARYVEAMIRTLEPSEVVSRLDSSLAHLPERWPVSLCEATAQWRSKLRFRDRLPFLGAIFRIDRAVLSGCKSE